MNLSDRIKDEAHRIGFDICGIARVRPLHENREILEQWVGSGMNSEMKYLGRDTIKRSDPSVLLPGAKSVVVTGMSYYTARFPGNAEAPVISRYANGTDYHVVIRWKLDRLLAKIQSLLPGSAGMPFVDTSPIMEKAWAVEAGIGWQGKHSVVINKSIGSFFFIGGLILDSMLEYDHPAPGDYCGHCRLCIENCPTGAINENRTIDARKCIANLTIENRDPVPAEIVPKLGGRVYGCDRCQEVCPWNAAVTEHDHPEFVASEEIMNLNREGWLGLTETDFKRLFSSTAMNRVRYSQFMRNLHDALKSDQREQSIHLLW